MNVKYKFYYHYHYAGKKCLIIIFIITHHYHYHYHYRHHYQISHRLGKCLRQILIGNDCVHIPIAMLTAHCQVIVSLQLIVGNKTLGVLTLRSLSQNFNLINLLKCHCLHPWGRFHVAYLKER